MIFAGYLIQKTKILFFSTKEKQYKDVHKNALAHLIEGTTKRNILENNLIIGLLDFAVCVLFILDRFFEIINSMKYNNNYTIGYNYYIGEEGYEQDTERAIVHFKYALDEGYFLAAYELGLCYSEEKNDVDKAIEYMILASENRIIEASEWLADYYREKDFYKYMDYVVLSSDLLMNDERAIINKLNEHCNSVCYCGPDEIISLIGKVETWWKKIRNQESVVKKALGRNRANLIESLCDILKQYALVDETRDELKDFLTPYYDKYVCVIDAFDEVDFLLLVQDIQKAATLEELEILKEHDHDFKDPYFLETLKTAFECRKVVLIMSKDDLSDTDIDEIKNCSLKSCVFNTELLNIEKAVVRHIDKALSRDDLSAALKFCDCLDKSSTLKTRYQLEIEKRFKQREERNEKKEPTYYHKLDEDKSRYNLDHTEESFHQFFDDLWNRNFNGKMLNDIVDLMVSAKQYQISFDYIVEKYNDRLFKEIMPYLPLSFFSDDIVKIKQEIQRRNITKLVHFSPIINTDSILEHGLLSRTQLDINNIPSVQPDGIRRDLFWDYISLSITTINVKMLGNKMFNSSVFDDGYEVFEIDPCILYEYPQLAVYCNCNAARHDAPQHRKFGYDGLLSMFMFSSGGNIPTDIQSEVLFKGRIDKKYIKNHIHVGGKNG